MKRNKDKCHLLVSGTCHKTINVCDAEIKSRDCEKLLGVKIDLMLNSEEHLSNISKKSSCKINALSKVMPYVSLSKKRILMNSFSTSQFNY